MSRKRKPELLVIRCMQCKELFGFDPDRRATQNTNLGGPNADVREIVGWVCPSCSWEFRARTRESNRERNAEIAENEAIARAAGYMPPDDMEDLP